mmetsp:Transcript_22898/g.46597  ORF Transcript_22898/g.46597 Transcript_22898/m.46597 type:complete len:455 (+) Transcript_22898:17-1381(+)
MKACCNTHCTRISMLRLFLDMTKIVSYLSSFGLSLHFVLLHQLLLRIARNRRVMRILHRELSLSLSQTPQFGRISEHIGERDLHNQLQPASILIHITALNHSHTTTQRSGHRTLELRRNFDFNIHHWFKDVRLGFLHGVTDGIRHANSERHIGRIDSVTGSVFQYDADSLDFASDQGTFDHGVVHTLFATGIIFGWNVGADTPILEFVGLAQFGDFFFCHGFDVTHDFGVLTCSSGLLFVEPVERRLSGNCFFVIDVRLSRDAFHIVLSLHPFNVNLKMKLSHATQHSLLRIRIHLNTKSGILLCKLCQRLGEIILHLRLRGLHGQTHDRLGNEHGTHGQIHISIRESIHGSAIYSEHGHDISCGCFIYLFHFVGVHADDAGEFDFLSVVNVVDVVAFFEEALVDSHVGKLSKRCFFQFECECQEWIVFLSGYEYGFFVFGAVQGVILFFDGFW